MSHKEGIPVNLAGELELIAAAISPGMVISSGLADVISRVCMEARAALEGGEEGE